MLASVAHPKTNSKLGSNGRFHDIISSPQGKGPRKIFLDAASFEVLSKHAAAVYGCRSALQRWLPRTGGSDEHRTRHRLKDRKRRRRGPGDLTLYP
jgi:hypothetical protein